MTDSSIMPSQGNTSADSTSSERLQGRVKWFNSRAGYGFITVSDGERQGTDVFVHHTGLTVTKEQYKYLVQGEYVDFVWCETPDGDHEYQAGDVRGVGGNMLMCETRQANRETRQERGQERSDTRSNTREERRPVRVRGEGPREGEEWMLVRRKVPVGSGKQWNKGRRQN